MDDDFWRCGLDGVEKKKYYFPSSKLTFLILRVGFERKLLVRVVSCNRLDWLSVSLRILRSPPLSVNISIRLF